MLVLKAEKKKQGIEYHLTADNFEKLLRNGQLEPHLTQLTFGGINMPAGLVLTFGYGNLPFDPDLRSPLFVSVRSVFSLLHSFDLSNPSQGHLAQKSLTTQMVLGP